MIEDGNIAELPRGWVHSRIDMVANLIRGVSYKKNESSKTPKEGYVPILRATNIDGKLNFDELVHVPIARVKPEQFIKELDVIIAMSSGSKHLVGKAAQATSDFEGGFGTFCGLVRPSSLICGKFVGLFFHSPPYKKAIGLRSSGININNLRREHIESMPFAIAPLAEQKRIVAKIEELFTKLDTGVEALKKIRRELKRYRQAVLKYAFEGKLTEQWRHKNKDKIESASKLLERIAKEREKKVNGGAKKLPPLDTSTLHELPESWEWASIGTVAESMKNGIYKPRSFYSDDGIACLRMYNIYEGKLLWEKIKRMNLTSEEVEEYRLEKGDVLVNRVNSRELVGKAAAIPENLEPCVYESKNIRLRLYKDYVNSKYVSFWFLLYAQRYFNRNAQQVVGMASVNQGQLGSMPIPIVCYEEQNKIVAEIERHFSIADQIEQTVKQGIKQSNRLRQSILKKAFEGKLVPQDPEDEPAEKLLERIKTEKVKLQVW